MSRPACARDRGCVVSELSPQSCTPGRPVDLRRPERRKRGHCEEELRGSFWRGTTIEIESRLRIGRAIAKTEEEVAIQLMAQLKARGHSKSPPALATDGKGSYREAMLETWGQVPEYRGRGRAPTQKQPGPDWHYLQVVKERSGSRLIAVHTQVVYGDPEEVRTLLGEHTAYVERTHLTSRQMNGRLVCKSLSYSKRLKLLRAACSWEDWVSNLTRPVKTLRRERVAGSGQQRWQARRPATVPGLTDHIWTIKELLTTVVIPLINTE
jgi:hypothetical protein